LNYMTANRTTRNLHVAEVHIRHIKPGVRLMVRRDNEDDTKKCVVKLTLMSLE
jgi:hypothetical protein